MITMYYTSSGTTAKRYSRFFSFVKDTYQLRFLVLLDSIMAGTTDATLASAFFVSAQTIQDAPSPRISESRNV
jgi:hypothetical protein